MTCWIDSTLGWPILWALVMTQPLFCGAPNIYTLMEWWQEAISRALEFGWEDGLVFGAHKTEVIIFTCKRLKVSGLLGLCMGNRDLAYCDTKIPGHFAR